MSLDPARRALALSTQDAPPAPWYRMGPIQAATAPDDAGVEAKGAHADVYVYDAIGGWFGVTADDFVRDVASLDVDAITLHVNSPGGDVFDGVAIANVLRAHRARVTVAVDGLAASAASVIAMAGDEVVMGVGAQMMVHDAWGVCVGNAADMTKQAAALASVSDSIASTYASRAGGTAAQWRSVMVEEAWYSAEEAVTAGLADRLAGDGDRGSATGQQVTPGGSSSMSDWWDSAAAADRFDLSAFHYAGRAAAPPPPSPAARPANRPTPQEDDVTSTLSDGLRQRLGVTDESADADTLLAALDEVLTEHAETPPVPAATQASAALPDGVVAIDADQLAALQVSARRGDAARTEQEAAARLGEINAAIRDGKIPPARRDHYVAMHQADAEGTRALLAQLAAGTIPVGESYGYADGSGTGSEPETEAKPASLDEVRATTDYQNWRK